MTSFYGTDLSITGIDSYELRWVLHWESDLSEGEHRQLTGLLADIYPAHTARFKENCSWSGAKPEGRLVGYLGENAVAHLALCDEFYEQKPMKSGYAQPTLGWSELDPSYRERESVKNYFTRLRLSSRV